jgi:hypothetical protein
MHGSVASTFVDRRRKMIFFHGFSDPTLSALDTVDYHDDRLPP